MDLGKIASSLGLGDLPKDPAMLLSFINTKLRDGAASLSDLCKTLGIDEADIKKRLGAAGFKYDEVLKKFL